MSKTYDQLLQVLEHRGASEPIDATDARRLCERIAQLIDGQGVADPVDSPEKGEPDLNNPDDLAGVLDKDHLKLLEDADITTLADLDDYLTEHKNDLTGIAGIGSVTDAEIKAATGRN